MTAISFYPLKWEVPLNPKDEVDYTFNLLGNLLEVGEAPTSWDLVLSDASIAAGLTMGSGPYAKSLSGTIITVWFSIDPARQADTAFDGIGCWLDMTVSVDTNHSPPRARERTLMLRVARQ